MNYKYILIYPIGMYSHPYTLLVIHIVKRIQDTAGIKHNDRRNTDMNYHREKNVIFFSYLSPPLKLLYVNFETAKRDNLINVSFSHILNDLVGYRKQLFSNISAFIQRVFF